MMMWQRLVSLLPFEWAHYAFMQNALLAVICSSTSGWRSSRTPLATPP